ncbi:pyridoxal phosphate-dependent decarboxylase family protein [Colwellia sp. RE-S-Sl-9]
MKPTKNEWDNLPQYISAFSEITSQFIQSIDNRPVASKNQKVELSSLSKNGRSLKETLSHIDTNLIPHLSASRGPRYWGFVTGGATPIATLADWLVSTFDQNVSKDGDSISSAIENQTLQWLCELFKLPNTFKGSLTTGATAANFLSVITARQFIGNQQGIDVAKQGLFNLEIEVFTTTPHASMIKSLGMAGLGQQQISYIPALNQSEKINVSALAQLLAKSSSKGKLVIASAATVTATDFDDLVAISKLCKKYNAWLHVDAAFGIFERLVNGVNGKTKGIELADSITLDCHKWLNVPYECGVFLTQHRQALFDTCDVPAPYLVSNSKEPSFMSLGIENSRRFRALPIWLSLIAYGESGIKHWVESNIHSAKTLANFIEDSDRYDLVFPCQLNVVLFKPTTKGLSVEAANQLTSEYLNEINKDGRLFLSPGQWEGKTIIRAAISNWQTDLNDIEIAKAVLIDVDEKMKSRFSL